MFRKRRSRRRLTAKNKPLNLGKAPINDEMYNAINNLKNCTADEKDAGEALGETIKQLVQASLEQLAKQNKKNS